MRLSPGGPRRSDATEKSWRNAGEALCGHHPIAEVKITWIGGNCPVQAEGVVCVWTAHGEQEARAFYYRARGSHWNLRIQAKGVPVTLEQSLAHSRLPGLDAIFDKDAWNCGEDWPGDECAAGWQTIPEALECIAKALSQYQKHCAAQFRWREGGPA